MKDNKQREFLFKQRDWETGMALLYIGLWCYACGIVFSILHMLFAA